MSNVACGGCVGFTGGGVGGYGGGFANAGMILVLFILLVIVTKGILC